LKKLKETQAEVHASEQYSDRKARDTTMRATGGEGEGGRRRTRGAGDILEGEEDVALGGEDEGHEEHGQVDLDGARQRVEEEVEEVLRAAHARMEELTARDAASTDGHHGLLGLAAMLVQEGNVGRVALITRKHPRRQDQTRRRRHDRCSKILRERHQRRWREEVPVGMAGPVVGRRQRIARMTAQMTKAEDLCNSPSMISATRHEAKVLTASVYLCTNCSMSVNG